MHPRSAKRAPRISRAIGAAIEKLEPRRMLCMIGPDGTEYHFDGLHKVKANDVDVKIPKNSKLHHDLHDPAPLQDAPVHNPRLAALSARSKVMGPQAPISGNLSAFAANTNLIGPQSALVGSQATGTLTGKVVYTSGGHGYTYTSYFDSVTGTTKFHWVTQRGLTNGMVEDMGVQDQMSLYADYLLNAGATVVPMRPVGHQTNQVIVDNTSSGFSFQSGSWTASAGTPYFSTSANGYDSVNSVEIANHYQFAATSLTETAVARYTPTLTTAGFYPVYSWALNSANRAADQTYRINYTGGSYEVHVDHQKTGKGWVYLGTYYFAPGTGGNVEISNKSATTGKNVIADAIRFGNGMGDFNPGSPGISGQSREDEAALYWLYRSRGYGAAATLVSSTTVDGGFSDDIDANVGAPIRWAAYMNDSAVGSATDRIYLGFHSNAFNGTARGALGLTSSSNPTPHQNDWATKAQAEIQNDLQGIGSPPLEFAFPNHTAVLSGAYGEISNGTIGGEFDATIIEVAFHDNASDAALMKDPKVRDAVARAEYQATVKYFNAWGGTTATMAPDLPTNVRATTDAAENVVLSWNAPAANASTGGAGTATGYRVYSSTNGYGFSLVANLGNVLTTTLAGQPLNAVTYYRIVATNTGGDSMPSFVVAAKPQAGRRAPILIVNNFDRMDRFGDDTESSLLNATSSFTYSRVRPRYNNSYDYSVQAASAIASFNPSLGIETATDAAVAAGQIVLANYHTVIWMSGEQSAGDGTFTSTVQPKVTTYLTNGGKMFISGAEIGWDLVAQNNGSSFYQNTLHTNYVSDDGNDTDPSDGIDPATYATIAGVGALAGVPALTYDNGTYGTYDVGTPDVIASGSGASVALRYVTGGAAAIQYTSGPAQIINMGFPFESIYTESQRNSLMSAVLTYFDVNSTTAIISPAPTSVDLLTDSGSTPATITDNITNYNNSSPAKALQFQVSGTISGATIRIYRGATLLGSAVASGSSTLVTTDGSVPDPNTLSEGLQSITARQIVPGDNESADSPALSITIDTTPPAVPSKPDLSFASDSGFSNSDNITIDLTPTFLVTAISGTKITIFRDTTLATTLTATGGADFVTLSTQPQGIFNYTATATDPADNTSAATAALSVTLDATAPNAPNAPVADATSTTVALDWNDVADANLWGYDVYRATVAGGPYTKINASPLPTSDFTDTGRTPGTRYFYVTRTEDLAGNVSVNSIEATSTTIPLNPTNLTAVAVSGRQINLAWSLPTGNREGISVERRQGNGSWSVVATLTATAVSFSDTDPALNPNTSYGYQIRAFTGAANSGYSAESTATTYKFGDIDGNGSIDFDDYFFIDYGFANKLSGWNYGDFNADGVVNQLDYNIIDNAFLTQ